MFNEARLLQHRKMPVGSISHDVSSEMQRLRAERYKDLNLTYTAYALITISVHINYCNSRQQFQNRKTQVTRH